MNPNNYATLEQSKRLKKLNFPQDKTDCVWIRFEGEATFHLEARCKFTPETYRREFVAQWYATPNAQEVELSIQCAGVVYYVGNPFGKKWSQIDFNQLHHAQARCDAKIWELEDKK